MVTSGFFNSDNGDRKYDIKPFNRLFLGIIRDGVFQHVGGRFNVTPGEDLTIIVDSGKMWYRESWIDNDAPISLNIDQSDLLYTRIDAVVAHFDDPTVKNGRFNDIRIIKGIPASEPAKPDLEDTDKKLDVIIAYITVDVGITEITQSKIEYMVGQTPCPFVTGPLETMSIEDQVARWNSEWQIWSTAKYEEADLWFENFTEENVEWSSTFEAEMIAWKNHLADELDEHQAIHLQLQIDKLYVPISYENYNNLSDAEKMNGNIYYVSGGPGGVQTASNVIYDNTESGLEGHDVQAAVDEVCENLSKLNNNGNIVSARVEDLGNGKANIYQTVRLEDGTTIEKKLGSEPIVFPFFSIQGGAYDDNVYGYPTSTFKIRVEDKTKITIGKITFSWERPQSKLEIYDGYNTFTYANNTSNIDVNINSNATEISFTLKTFRGGDGGRQTATVENIVVV